MEPDNQNQAPTSGVQPPTGNNQASPEVGPPAPAPGQSVPPVVPSGDKKKMLIIGGVVIALLVLGAVFVVASQNKKPEESTTSHSPSDTSTSNSDSTATDTPASDPQSGEVNVDIKDFAYAPEKITVKKGSKVTWTNQDSAQHNVVSDSDSPQKGLDGPLLAKGKSYSFTFDTVGEYKYHCQPHPNMVGTIEVVE